MAKKAKKKSTLDNIFKHTPSSDIIAESNRRLVINTLIVAAFVFLCGGFLLSFLGFDFNQISKNFSSFVEEKSAYPFVVAVSTESRTESWVGQPSTITAGSGIIVTRDGYVLTNKHIVEGAKSIMITLPDGTAYKNVQLTGVDPLNDVAILKIDHVDSLPVAELGDSSAIYVGQVVTAVGNALGQFQNTVSIGIVSGNNRVINAPVVINEENNNTDSSNHTSDDKNSNWPYGSYYNKQLNDMIQTDASINPGNSGGPLVDNAGRVIGINTTISADDGSEINFAIPINSAKGALKTLIETGKFERAFLGIRYVNLTPDTAKAQGLSVSAGALLPDSQSIISGTPAENSGLKEKDIITKINGKEIGRAGSLFTLIGEHSVGETIELTYLRDGNEYTTKITLAAYKGES